MFKMQTLIVPATLVSLLAGCSGSTEDVRVTFCKSLVEERIGASNIAWSDVRETFNRPSYVTLSLSYPDGSASCRYAYTAVEESALDHAQPLAAYDTLPYEMTLNGQTITGRDLLKSVNAVQMRHGREAVAELRATAEKGVKAVQDAARQ